jgi:hypothetical protein
MKERDRIKKYLKRTVAALLPLCILSVSLAAPASGKKEICFDKKVNYAAVQQDIREFEAVLHDVIHGFSKGWLGVTNEANGAYIEGVGFSFTFLIDIQRAITTTPFGVIKRFSATAEQKKQRIEDLKDKLLVMLQDNRKNLKQLRKEEYVTIIALIDDQNMDDKNILAPSARITIVLRVAKKDLDELGSKNIKELRQRIKIVEY